MRKLPSPHRRLYPYLRCTPRATASAAGSWVLVCEKPALVNEASEQTPKAMAASARAKTPAKVFMVTMIERD
jgi:hypothetical protein